MTLTTMLSTMLLAVALGLYAATTLFSMAVMSIGAAVLVIVLALTLGPRGVIKGLVREWNSPAFRSYFWISLSLALACSLSLVCAAFWPLSYAGKHPHIRFLTDIAKTWYLFWPLLLVVALRALPSSRRRVVLRFWLGIFALLAVIGIVQYFTGWPRPQGIPGLPGRFHATLFLGHHLSVASILIFPFFALLDLNSRKESAVQLGLPRVVLTAVVAAGAVMLFLTYSRMLWISLPIGIACWVLLSFRRRQAFVVLAVLAVAAVAMIQVPQVRQRALDSMGISTRGELWKVNMHFFAARPLTGTGWHHNLELAGYYFEEHPVPGENFVGHAHNNVIEMAASTGIVGLVAWLAWCVFAIWLVAKPEPGLAFARGILCAWVVFHLNGLTQVNFWESKVLHQLAWVLAFSLLWSGSRAAGEVHD